MERHWKDSQAPHSTDNNLFIFIYCYIFGCSGKVMVSSFGVRKFEF